MDPPKDKSCLTNPNALLGQKTAVWTKHRISLLSHLEGEEAQAAKNVLHGLQTGCTKPKRAEIGGLAGDLQ